MITKRKPMISSLRFNISLVDSKLSQRRIVCSMLVVCSQLLLGLGNAVAAEPTVPPKPNIVVIFTDDQGYGDLGCYGATQFNTPQLDSLAKDGTKFTSFYAQVVCGPSRSALLTGRYPHRSLGWSMPGHEITVAELLRGAGYATCCIGKWDVSNRAAIEDRMPNAQGFEYYWGTLGANDSGKVVFHENNKQVGETSDMGSLTKLYTDKAIEYLKANHTRPIFVYLSHTMAHSVIGASPDFRGKSKGGLYGDMIEELDFHSGRLLDAIDELGLREETLVIFTTDNGPWNNMQDILRQRHDGEVAWGSSGPLREGKGSTYEGGLRVPCLARWPGKIPAGRTNDAIFATIDFLPTFAKLAGTEFPNDRFLDGVDQTNLLLGVDEIGSRHDYFFLCKNELHGVRKGNYKLLLSDRRQHYGYVKDKGTDNFELYDLAIDLGEKNNLAAEKPDIVAELKRHITTIPHPDRPPDDRIAVKNAASTAKATKNDGKTLVEGQWQAHGFEESGRETIRAAFQEGIDRKVIPGGSLMILHQGEVVLREAFGVADLESKAPYTVDAPCRIASLTKPHTATLMTILAERGLLNLDDPIDRYLPEFREMKHAGKLLDKRAPTIRQCLSHTAGFPGNDVMRGEAETLGGVKTLGEMVEHLAARELANPPGTKYEYSGAGYSVVGRIAEVVTGRPFQDLMRRYLLEPIGAETATFAPLPEVALKLPTSYDRNVRGLIRRERELGPRIVGPGGSLISTLDDIARLMLLHRNQGKVGAVQVVAAESLKQMVVSQPSTGPKGYGLGFNILAKRADGTASRVQHTGASGTLALIDFDHDLIVIVLTQVDQRKIGGWRARVLQSIFDSCK
jgi:arylsulfatase A-like enzyme/CubicO group peptidase (beta-lactamase class C family)